ncbi:histidine kinase famiy protein [Brevundimonas lutea]|uniref:histidine kinase famiy protein n=1 Tax=Brevundimonas lutea TaxID=2293980 RepID=UPI000F040270|nr:histidine kinase famiy protein [Brevundimonas lutea]
MSEPAALKHPAHPSVSAEGFSGQDDIFFAAVEMTRMPMIVTDPNLPDNPIVFANVAFHELSGYATDELVGRNCRFLQGEDTDRETVAAVRNAIEKRTDIAVEILNYRKDGSAFWNALFISPVFASDGRLLYFFASQLDVSRRKDAEDALRQAQKMEAVGQLTGGIAHDFNNLLTVVMGNLDSALTRTDDPALRRRLEAALEASRRAETLTGQMLAFARKQRLDGRPTNLNRLVDRLRELVDRTLGSSIEIDSAFADDLKLARVDPVQAEVALLNILINARDAMPDGGKVCIRTHNRSLGPGNALGLTPGEYVELTVEDSGGGIPPDILSRVTEPFFTTKEVGQGTGMGLAMVYGFMRQSHGRLEIDSVEGQGATVRLIFPSAAGEEATPSEAPGRAPRGGTETILMVEDNAEVRQMGCGILEDFGYTVVTAATAIEALQRIDDGVMFDLLFTDIVMPGGMNGVTLANEVHKRDPQRKILLTTGWADRAVDIGDEAERAGYELIGKPYRRTDLARRVRAVLDGASGV